jgi:hypothetical protein
MDMLRVCYKTRMRLWQGSPDEVPIRWYRASASAGYFNDPHPFGSTLWRRDRPAAFVPIAPGELGEVSIAPGEYDRGRNLLQYRGHNFCGHPTAITGGGREGVDPPIVTDPDGSSPCCAVPNPFAIPFLDFTAPPEF